MLVERGAIARRDGGWVATEARSDDERPRLDPRGHRRAPRPPRGRGAGGAAPLLGHGPRVLALGRRRGRGPRRGARAPHPRLRVARLGVLRAPRVRLQARADPRGRVRDAAPLRARRAAPARRRVAGRGSPRPAGGDDGADRVPLRRGAPLGRRGRRAPRACVRGGALGRRLRVPARHAGRSEAPARPVRSSSPSTTGRACSGARPRGARGDPRGGRTSGRSSTWSRGGRDRRVGGRVQLLADALGLRARASWLRGHWTDALEAAETAVASLDGEPESPSLARALGRLSQIQMLRALPAPRRRRLEAIEVARRTGERARRRTRASTCSPPVDRRAAAGRDEVAAVVDLACAAGAHDEATRAVVNYLWARRSCGRSSQSSSSSGADAVARARPRRGAVRLLPRALARRARSTSRRPLGGGGRRARERGAVAWRRTGWCGSGSSRGSRSDEDDLELVDRHLPEFAETRSRARSRSASCR